MFQAKKTHFMLNIVFFPPENRAVCEIMWENIAKPDRPQMTTWRMRTECWIPKATNAHLEYAFLIALPVHQLGHERPSTLPRSYTACYFLYKANAGSEAPHLRTRWVPWILKGDKFVGA